MQDDRKMQNSKICYYINDIIMKNLSKLLNIDLKSIPEGLSKSLDVLLIARKSSIKKSFNINLSKIKISSNIITFLCKIFKTFRMKSSNYLLISIFIQVVIH